MTKYGSGALITLLAAAGAVLILSGIGVVTVQPLAAVGIVLAAFGIYTIAYATVSGNQLYYMLWGGVALVVGAGLTIPATINPLIAIGLLLILIAALGAYALAKKK